MPYLVSSGEREFLVDVKPEGGAIRVRLGERELAGDAMPVGPGLYSLLIDGRSYEVDVIERKDKMIALVKGQAFPVVVQDELYRRLKATRAGRAFKGMRTVTAPMPGKVVRHLVKAGDQVKVGDGVIVVEAMKMENELRSPAAGVVQEIRAAEGSVVAGGDVLAVIR